jgi:CubicO group peptidase (beta-lactamase class C family)
LVDAIPADQVQSKSTIAIHHLLTMSAGLEWDEDTLPTSDPRNDFTRLERSFDPIGFILGKPLIEQPGYLFWYNTGLSHVLSALVAKVSGQTTLEFARGYLFEPLGIEDVRWNRDRQGIYFGGTQLYLKPRDLARIGVLCLNGGIWDGQQIVSSDWLALSTRTHILGRTNYFEGRGYAYQWWTLDDYGVYYASGSQGQALYIFPELDLVIAFTATILEGAILPEILVRDYVLPAILGASEDSDSEAR